MEEQKFCCWNRRRNKARHRPILSINPFLPNDTVTAAGCNLPLLTLLYTCQHLQKPTQITSHQITSYPSSSTTPQTHKPCDQVKPPTPPENPSPTRTQPASFDTTHNPPTSESHLHRALVPTTSFSTNERTNQTAMASTEPAHHYHFDITMTCGGCSGAVERVLKKTEGRALFPFLPSPPLPPSSPSSPSCILCPLLMPPPLPSSLSVRSFVRSSVRPSILHIYPPTSLPPPLTKPHRPRLLRRQPRGPDRGRLHRRRPLCRRAREDQEDGQDGPGGRGGRGGDGCLNGGKEGRWGWVWVGLVWFGLIWFGLVWLGGEGRGGDGFTSGMDT